MQKVQPPLGNQTQPKTPLSAMYWKIVAIHTITIMHRIREKQLCYPGSCSRVCTDIINAPSAPPTPVLRLRMLDYLIQLKF